MFFEETISGELKKFKDKVKLTVSALLGYMSDVSKFIYIRLNRTYLALLLWKSLEN